MSRPAPDSRATTAAVSVLDLMTRHIRGGRLAILAFGSVFAALRCSRTQVRSASVLAKASPKAKLTRRANET